MEYKKYSYILVLILMLIVGINRTYADSEKNCYYISDDDNFKVLLTIGYNKTSANPNKIDEMEWANANIWKTGEGKYPRTEHFVENWFKTKKINSVSMTPIYANTTEANNDTNPTCPKYIIYASCPASFIGINLWWDNDAVFATDSITLSSQAISASSECSYAKYASNYKDGKQITKDVFIEELEEEGLIKKDDSKSEYTCATMQGVFGNAKDDGETYDPDGDGTASIRYIINEVLGAIRIIVPILIILLGMVDFAKATIAGKEDNMKKAQNDFIKRIIAGVVVFLVPTLVDIIMGLADIVWQGTGYVPCNFL